MVPAGWASGLISALLWAAPVLADEPFPRKGEAHLLSMTEAPTVPPVGSTGHPHVDPSVEEVASADGDSPGEEVAHADASGDRAAHPHADAPGDRAAHVHAHVHSRADDHAPIGVMGDHIHPAGEVMLSYRMMRMSMNGSRDGTQRASTASVLRNYPVTPYDMDMEMHMLGLMWAPTDRITLMVMAPFVRLDMKHRSRSGQKFTTRSNGLGDLSLTALVGLLEGETHRAHLHAGVSFPTGTISAKDDTPAGRLRLPYPMQLGSGTFDLLPGLTVEGGRGNWSWGAQAKATLRTGTNRKGYRWGNRWGGTAWVGRSLADSISTSLRLEYEQWYDIRGDDDALIPALVPTADPDLRAGERLDLLLGLNFLFTGGPLRGHRLAIELGRPVHQDLDGPQLEEDWRVTMGWQLAF